MIFNCTARGIGILIDYTNHEGVREKRMITPISIQWGSNRWHPEPQWLMNAWCHRTKDERTFALKGIHQWNMKQ